MPRMTPADPARGGESGGKVRCRGWCGRNKVSHGPKAAPCWEREAAPLSPAKQRKGAPRAVLINADAHAKNFSLLHKDGAITLAPLYDLLSIVIYPELSPKLAMKVGGKVVLKHIDARHWDRFAANARLGAPFVRARVRQMGDAVVTAIDSNFGKWISGEANVPEVWPRLASVA